MNNTFFLSALWVSVNHLAVAIDQMSNTQVALGTKILTPSVLSALSSLLSTLNLFSSVLSLVSTAVISSLWTELRLSLSSLQAWLRTSSCPCQDTSTYWWSTWTPTPFVFIQNKSIPQKRVQKLSLALPELCPSCSPGSHCRMSLDQPPSAEPSPPMSFPPVFFIYLLICALSLQLDRKAWALESTGDGLGFLFFWNFCLPLPHDCFSQCWLGSFIQTHSVPLAFIWHTKPEKGL